MDVTDSRLGFFASWVTALSEHLEHVEVICLNKGRYDLPSNVSVSSLGKETLPAGVRARGMYTLKLFSLIWHLRREYDAVFVHMNQEYVLLGGLLWKLWGKPVFMWRNHYDGDLGTWLAAHMSKKVFYTSSYSYTARFSHAVRMPVGVDIQSAHATDVRMPHSILSLGRLDESKRAELLLQALDTLASQGATFRAIIAGGPTDPHSHYPEQLKQLARTAGIQDRVNFPGPIPDTDKFRYFNSHEIFVNCSRSGMLDKTIFEAMVSGCLILVSSKDVAGMVDPMHIFRDGDAEDLAKKLSALLAMPEEKKHRATEALASVADTQSLPLLAKRLIVEMSATRVRASS